MRRTRSWLAAAAMAMITSALPLPATAASTIGGALRVAFAEPIGVLDPHAFTGHLVALDLVYEPLVEYGEGGELLPGLATSWDVAPDGLAVTFHLRDGVRFHDGTPFDADAVKWNLDRWVHDPDFGFFRTSSVIDSVDVVDPATVTLALTEPYAPLLQELSIGRPVRFLSPSSAGADGAFVEPIGTGPWRFVRSSDTGAVFERNDDYWGEPPDLESVEVSVIPDSQTRVSALRAGDVDLLGGAYMAPISAVEASDMSTDDELTVMAGDADTTLVLGFNPATVTGDESVRRAVSLATDVASINEVLYGGASEPADSLFPATIADAPTGTAHTFDPDAASAVLDDGGWTVDGDVRTNRDSNGETDLHLRLVVVSGSAHGQQDSRITGQALADALNQIGVDVTIEALDGSGYFDALANGDYDLAFFTTFGAPYDPSSSAVSFLTAAGADTPLWTDDRLDGLVDAAVSAADDAARRQAYQAIEEHLVDVTAFVPITHPPRYYAVGPAVSGFQLPITDYDLDLAGVTVER